MAKYYNLADDLTEKDCLGLGISTKFCLWSSKKISENVKVVAKKSKEYREPKKGEWFISGAIGEAYHSPNDLSNKYHIAKLVLVKSITKLIEYENFADIG